VEHGVAAAFLKAAHKKEIHMPLTIEYKQAVIKKYCLHEKDTGSSDV